MKICMEPTPCAMRRPTNCLTNEQMRDANLTYNDASQVSDKNPSVAPPLRVSDCSQITDGSAALVLKSLKRGLTYLLRYEAASKGSRLAHADLETTEIALDRTIPKTPESVVRQVVAQLPTGWHATALPSHIIVYKNDTRKFPSGRLIVRSPEL